jgi:carboxyl-terminal processing protease
LDGVNWKRAIYQAIAVGIILTLGIVFLLAGFVLTNHDNLGRLLRVVYLIESQYLEEVPRIKLVDGAIEGMVSSLDPYSSFQDAEENETLMNTIKGSFGGIGVHISTADPTQLVVMRPIKGSPAERAGLEAGDVIVRIDDTDVAKISQDQAIAMLRGDPGTGVTVGVYRPRTGQELTFNLIRESINVPTVSAAPVPGRPELAMIDISNFTLQTGDELERAFRDLDIEKYKGFILDLRFNYGGEINAAIKVASLLVPGEDIVHIVDKSGNLKTKKATAKYINKPFVVLINEYSASSSEIVAGAVKDYGSGILVGTKTFGKGVVQTVFPLDGMTSVRLTTDKYLTPLKKDIHQKGIEPDIQIELQEGENPTIMPTEAKFDSQLAKAVEVLLQKI